MTSKTSPDGSASEPQADAIHAPKTRWRRAFRLLTEVLLIGGLFWGIQLWQTRSLLHTDAQMPLLQLPDQQGNLQPLWDEGKPTVLFLFAPWCSVCKISAHNLVALRQRRSVDALSIKAIGLSWKSPQNVWQYGQDHDFNFPVLLGDNAALQAFRLEAFPTIYVLDAKGRVRHRAVGYTTELGLLLRTL